MTSLRNRVDVRWSGETVAWLVGGAPIVSGKWDAFDGAVAAMRRVLRGESTSEIGGGLEFRRSAPNELTIPIGGREQVRIPDKHAQRLLAATRDACRSAEAQNHRVLTQQVQDGALLARSGFPFGLSNDPRVKAAIANEAATNRTLRLALPFAQARGIPGTPRVDHISKPATLRVLSEQYAQQKRDLYGDN